MSLPEPALNWRWRVYLPDTGSLLGFGKSVGLGGLAGEAKRLIGSAVNSVVGPGLISRVVNSASQDLINAASGALQRRIGTSLGLGARNGLTVESVQWTMNKVQQKQRFQGGRYIHRPDFHDIDPVTMVIYETENFDALESILKWKLSVVDSEGNYGLPADYMKDITMELWNQSSESAAMTRYLRNCWPTETAPLELNYTDSGRITLSVTFSADIEE
jgi:hypothetical protein